MATATEAKAWEEVLHFNDGNAFGVAPDGRTVCLGTETDIREMLADPTKRTGNPVIDGIIDLERELTKERESDSGQPTDINAKYTARKPGITDHKRIRPGRHVGHKQPNVGRPAKKQGLSLQNAKPEQPGISNPRSP